MALTSSQYIGPSDLTAEIGIPETTLAQWRYLKKGPPYIKVGRHVRYRQSDVERWLEEQTVITGDDAA
jgi:predicted DNA-binding transcriptional regulator AlpA